MRTPRTSIRISGFIPAPVLRVLRHEYGRDLSISPDTEGDDALEDVFGSKEYEEFKQRVTPADYVRTYRENSGLTQAELGERLGVSRAYVCDVEHGRRSISKEFAKELSTFFKVSVGRFIG